MLLETCRIKSRYHQYFPISDIQSVAVQVSVEDSIRRNWTAFEINIFPPDSLDCDLLTQDLCYWRSASYKIYENTKPSIIGSLSSPYLAEMCRGFTVNYTLVKGEYRNSVTVGFSDTNKPVT